MQPPSSDYYRPRFLLVWGKSRKSISTPVVWGPSIARVRNVAAHFGWTGWFAVIDLDTETKSEPFRYVG